MLSKWFSPMLVLLVAVLWFTSSAAAQFPRYAPPAGNPLPNQLNYFRSDIGLLDPYNSIVAPQQQINRDMQSLRTQQRADYRANQRTFSQLRDSQAAPTGVGAGFMNSGHYFGIQSGPGRGR